MLLPPDHSGLVCENTSTNTTLYSMVLQMGPAPWLNDKQSKKMRSSIKNLLAMYTFCYTYLCSRPSEIGNFAAILVYLMY